MTRRNRDDSKANKPAEEAQKVSQSRKEDDVSREQASQVAELARQVVGTTTVAEMAAIALAKSQARRGGNEKAIKILRLYLEKNGPSEKVNALLIQLLSNN